MVCVGFLAAQEDVFASRSVSLLVSSTSASVKFGVPSSWLEGTNAEERVCKQAGALNGKAEVMVYEQEEALGKQIQPICSRDEITISIKIIGSIEATHTGSCSAMIKAYLQFNMPIHNTGVIEFKGQQWVPMGLGCDRVSMPGDIEADHMLLVPSTNSKAANTCTNNSYYRLSLIPFPHAYIALFKGTSDSEETTELIQAAHSYTILAVQGRVEFERPKTPKPVPEWLSIGQGRDSFMTMGIILSMDPQEEEKTCRRATSRREKFIHCH
ncbi:hypothetical protein BDR03DRAFT_984639 [Suillus americanus]|nr:hypothetical protein BDR03DRAFT_984639 [Suillus americanus]